MLVVLQLSKNVLVVMMVLRVLSLSFSLPLSLSQDVPVEMVVLQLSRNLLLVKLVLHNSCLLRSDPERTVTPPSHPVLVVLQLSQDLLVEHMIVHQLSLSAFEADRVQHVS